MSSSNDNDYRIKCYSISRVDVNIGRLHELLEMKYFDAYVYSLNFFAVPYMQDF